MKRLTVALAIIGLTSAVGVYAALPAATDPTLVNIPQLPGGFVIGLSGYYLQAEPTNGDLDYASANALTSVVTSTSVPSFFHSKLHNIQPGYDWGWGANIGYIFPNTGNDVNLSYFYLDSDARDEYLFNLPNAPFSFNGGFTPVVNGILSPLDGFPGDINGTPFNIAAAQSTYRINQVDLTAGQWINVGCRLRLHPNVGLRYANLERKLNSYYAGSNASLSTTIIGTTTATTNDTQVNIAEDSDFSGLGPLTGMDATYYIGMGLGAVAHADAALLIGSVDAETDVFASNAQFIAITNLPITQTIGNAGVFEYKNDSTRRVVPATDLKLGLDYTYMFNNAANSDVTLEIGWQASKYFHAVDRLTTLSVIPLNSAAAVSGGSSQAIGSFTSSVGLDGPYVNLVMHV